MHKRVKALCFGADILPKGRAIVTKSIPILILGSLAGAIRRIGFAAIFVVPASSYQKS